MSRFLMLSRKIAKICTALLLTFLGMICLLLGWPVLGFLLMAIGILNEIIRMEMKKELAPFMPRSLVRNVDYLFIGELCKTQNIVPEGSTFLQLRIPGASLGVAYEVLRHSFSILKDNGGVAVLVYKGKQTVSDKYSLFAVNFLIPLTIRQMHLEAYRIMKYFPLLFSPLKSLHLILNITQRGGITECPREDIVEFCEERNVNLICISI